MNWNIFAIGKPRLDYAELGIAEYLKRLEPMAKVRTHYLKGGKQAEESALLLERSEGMVRIALDERGEQISSRFFADTIKGWEQRSMKSVAILIGGADGHVPLVRSTCQYVWALSKLTLQHDLALVVFFEQLYRAYTIKNGLPYHRD
jgi:23S rRNA (pseudouridine1915-N3)-methyltransferase